LKTSTYRCRPLLRKPKSLRRRENELLPLVTLQEAKASKMVKGKAPILKPLRPRKKKRMSLRRNKTI